MNYQARLGEGTDSQDEAGGAFLHLFFVGSLQFAQRVAAGDLQDQIIFVSFHFASVGGREVVKTVEMQKAVRDVTEEFGLPGSFKLAGLFHGIVN